jgi:hypothetical protein
MLLHLTFSAWASRHHSTTCQFIPPVLRMEAKYPFL